jgi:hypothetical protein
MEIIISTMQMSYCTGSERWERATMTTYTYTWACGDILGGQWMNWVQPNKGWAVITVESRKKPGKSRVLLARLRMIAVGTT